MKIIPSIPWFALLLAGSVSCASVDKSQEDSSSIEQSRITEQDHLPAPVPGEEILDEKGNPVTNHKGEHPYFQEPSTDALEYFRVVVSSDRYSVRQIRGSRYIQRKPDPGGDELIQEEISNYNITNLADEGILYLGLNGNTGGIEVVNFDRRVPRINDIAKIIQNDVMRWNFLHELRDDKPQITRLKVFYRIELKKTMTREQIKEKFFNKKKK